MNHLTNIIQFYKLLKNDDVSAVEKLINNVDSNYFHTPIKRIKIENIELVFFNILNINQHIIDYDLASLYEYNIPFIPISLENRHFYLRPAKKQLLTNHIEVISITNNNMYIESDFFIYFEKFLLLFPSYLICYQQDKHFYFEAGLIGGNLLNEDANHYMNETYLVEWYMNVFLIKDTNLNIIKREYEKILNKYSDYIFDIIFFKRGDKYYLYLILKQKDSMITPIETLGIATINNNSNSISTVFQEVIDKLKTGKIF